MFGISMGEISVALLVAAIIFGPQEVAKIIKVSKRLLRKLHEVIQPMQQEIKQAAAQLEADVQETENKIIDLYGNEQSTYTIEDVKDSLRTVDKNHGAAQDKG